MRHLSMVHITKRRQSVIIKVLKLFLYRLRVAFYGYQNQAIVRQSSDMSPLNQLLVAMITPVIFIFSCLSAI